MVDRVLHAIVIASALLMPLAAEAAPTPMTRVPALFQNGQIYLRVRLDNAAPVWMALDIAAPASTLYAAHSARATVHSGTVAQTVSFHPSRTAAPCAPDGSIVAGRLGGDWLGDRIAEIRTREHEVWLSAPVDPPAERPLFAAAR